MNRFLKTRLLILLCWFSNQTLIYAQKEASIWYFGTNAGVTFNTEPPTSLADSKMSTREGCSSIADEKGNLLFYTDGQTVWNRLHQKMTNGTGLNGDASSTHSSVIVKKPYTDSIFYIVTADDWPDASNENKGVSYSVVDLRLNNGLGDILEKNTLMVAKSAEKIAATIHRNGSDIWIAVPEAGTNNIVMFLLTRNGIELHHLINNLYTSSHINWGQIKFSPNSKLLALTYPESITASSNTLIAIGNFDNLNGTISNPKFLTGSQNIYGLEFSPSSSLLYFSTWYGLPATSGIYQLDPKTTETNFYAACTLITSQVNGQLQLAKNGKIYTPGDSFLSVINHPDSAGMSCFYQANVIKLNTGKAWLGLPTFYGTYINKNRIEVEQTCLGDTSFMYATKDTSTYDSAHWFVNNDKIQTIHFSCHQRFLNPGYIKIKMVMFRQSFTDTFDRDIFIKTPTILHPHLLDRKLCFGDSAVLNAHSENGLTYEWNTGSIDSSITVYHSDTFIVKLSKEGCPLLDTAIVSIESPLESKLPADTLMCVGRSITLSVSEPDALCLWSTGDTTHSIVVTDGGNYSVKLSRNQCSTIDSVVIYQTDTPHIYLGEDTLVCRNAPFILNVTFPHSHYRWSNESYLPTLNANRDGTYWVQVSTICGATTDTIEITTKACECAMFVPDAFTPDNDLLNDIFTPRLNCPTQEYTFQVFDRWGQLLFESAETDKGWDGKMKQFPCSPDTYVWLVSYSMAPPIGNGQLLNKRGTVTLLR